MCIADRKQKINSKNGTLFALQWYALKSAVFLVILSVDKSPYLVESSFIRTYLIPVRS